MAALRRAWPLLLVALSLVVSSCSDDDSGTEGASFVDLDRAVGDEVRTTLATMLYENPGSRDYYLKVTRERHPDIWREVTADDDVTLAEFRSMPHVQDAVNHYGAEVLVAFRDHEAAAAGG